MEGSGLMTDLELPPASALPDAPLAMPKQVLERRYNFLAMFRLALLRSPLRLS